LFFRLRRQDIIALPADIAFRYHLRIFGVADFNIKMVATLRFVFVFYRHDFSLVVKIYNAVTA
jgi:hypothetical protein